MFNNVIAILPSS